MKYLIAFFGVLSLALIMLSTIVAYDLVRNDVALDLVEACIEENGATRICTITYDTNGIYLAISVGDTVAYCRNGYSRTC